MFDDVRRIDVRARLLAPARLSSLSLTRSERRTVARMLSEALTSHPGHVIVPAVGLRPSSSPAPAGRRGELWTRDEALRHSAEDIARCSPCRHPSFAEAAFPDAIGRTVVHRVRGLALPGTLNHQLRQVEQALIASYALPMSSMPSSLWMRPTAPGILQPAASWNPRVAGPRNAPLRSLLSQACPGARSLLETIARHDLERAQPLPRRVVVDRVGESGPGSPAGGLRRRSRACGGHPCLTAAACPAPLIETDGYTYHSPARTGTATTYAIRLLSLAVIPRCV